MLTAVDVKLGDVFGRDWDVEVWNTGVTRLIHGHGQTDEFPGPLTQHVADYRLETPSFPHQRSP